MQKRLDIRTLEINPDACFEPSCDNLPTEWHHIVPVSLGGTRTVPLCHECHGKVHGINKLSISELMKNWHKKRKESGQAIGPALYGSMIKEGERIENPEEVKILRKALRLRGLGFKYKEIAAELNYAGDRTRRNELWTDKNIRRIVMREINDDSQT